jgi:chemosensory pili system protein ChpA (sensor histidine kinase/response regulator)
LIRVRAYRDGSQGVIQVVDAGAGIEDRAVLRLAALFGYPVSSKGTTRERALQYIFLPGFTTRAANGDHAGGLGLDAVSGAVAEAEGSVTVHSELGRGTMFTLRLPVMTMVVPSIVVAVSGERFAVPQDQATVVERERVTRIDIVEGGYEARVDDQAWPAADLGALLGLRSPHHVQSDFGQFLELLQDGRRWLVRVDRVLTKEPITIQPVERQQRQVPGVVGGSTLSSSEQALVLELYQVLDGSAWRGRRPARQTASLAHVPFALVVDDSISVRRKIAQQLEAHGWRVVEARDAFEAREYLESVVPELLLVDLDLPAHGGLQVIRAARNLDDALVIGLQSRDDDESRQRARSLGVKSYLVKPVEPEQLLAAVRLATIPVSSNGRH